MARNGNGGTIAAGAVVALHSERTAVSSRTIFQPADCRNIADAWLAEGITAGTSPQGKTVRIADGPLPHPLGELERGTPLWLGYHGEIVASPPTDGAFARAVAISLGSGIIKPAFGPAFIKFEGKFRMPVAIDPNTGGQIFTPDIAPPTGQIFSQLNGLLAAVAIPAGSLVGRLGGGVVLADRDAAPPIPAEGVTLAAFAIGAPVAAYEQTPAVTTTVAGAAGGTAWLSGTPGSFATAAPPATANGANLAQAVGVYTAATVVSVNIAGPGTRI